MSTQKQDPIFESLDRLAVLADEDLVGDRMPDIQRRVRVSRQRKSAGLVAAAAFLAVGAVGVWHGMPGEGSARFVKSPHDTPTVTTPSVTPPTRTSGFTIFDQLEVDIDRDGRPDVARVLVPKDVNAENQLLEVSWGTGETTTATFPNTMETSFVDPVDLDSDGDLEPILRGGGGDTSVYTVFVADPRDVVQVNTVDAQGNALTLHSDTDPTAWQTYVGDDGVYSYQRTEPAATDSPFRVGVRTWSLAGNTLTQSTDSVAWCVVFQPEFVLGPC